MSKMTKEELIKKIEEISSNKEYDEKLCEISDEIEQFDVDDKDTLYITLNNKQNELYKNDDETEKDIEDLSNHKEEDEAETEEDLSDDAEETEDYDDLDNEIQEIKAYYSDEAIQEIKAKITKIEDQDKREQYFDSFDAKIDEIKLEKEELEKDEEEEEISLDTDDKKKKTSKGKKLAITFTAAGLAIIIGTGSAIALLNRKGEDTKEEKTRTEFDSDDDVDDITPTKETKKDEIKEKSFQHSTDKTCESEAARKNIERLEKFMKANDIEKREIHTLDARERMDLGDKFTSIYDNEQTGKRRQLIDSLNGDFAKIYSAMETGFACLKEIDGVELIWVSNMYGYQFAVEGSKKTGDNVDEALRMALDEVGSMRSFIEMIMRENPKMSYDDAIKEMVKRDSKHLTLSPEQYQILDDDVYSILYSFYEKYGIDDYYYLLDKKSDSIDELKKEDENRKEYTPAIERNGGKVKTLTK